MSEPQGNSILKIMKKLLIIIIAIYSLVCVSAYYFHEKLLFWPQKLSDEATTVSTKIGRVENVELKMKDGNKIRGWFVKNSASERSNLLIYFGARAEEVSSLIPKVAKFQNWSVVLINYRGYGTSEGTPGEKALLSDSLEIYDHFACRKDINKSNITVMGRSIGTDVATYLAEKRTTSAVILVSPFDSLASVAQEKCPIIPADFILQHKFDSISRAPSIKSPLYVLVASEDQLIPTWHSKRLADAWGGKVSITEIVGVNHDSIDDGEEYWNKINEILTQQTSN